MNLFLLFKGMGTRWYPFIFLCCFLALHTTAQNVAKTQQPQPTITVNGTITDENGVLPGVDITIKGQSNAVSSDANGKFTIEAKKEDTLVFSLVGYKTIEQPITKTTSLNIKMQLDTQSLKEVKVNAGYYSVKESEYTGSISKMTAKTIETQPVSNFMATMQGRMAGVNVIQETGVPGGGYTINIRGINSLRPEANAPLYIIDGVPYSSDPISNAQTSTSIPGDGNPLNSINPNDIQSIEVLKDADATSIYGSRGANGVVLITTKKGKAGKTTFMINTTTGVGEITSKMDLMNTQQYLQMRKQAFTNDGFTSYPSNAYDVNGTWDQNRYTDWQEELIGGTAEMIGLQATINGGSEKTRFLLSGNYRSETSVFPGDFVYKKGGARLSLNHTSSDNKFKLSFSSGYTVQSNFLPWIDFVSLSRSLAPNAPELYDEQGNLNWENSTWQNPLANLEGQNKSNTSDLLANTVLSYRILENLEIKANLGFTDLQNNETRISPSTIYDPAYNLGSEYSTVFANAINRQSWIVEPQINWNNTYGKSKIEVLVGGTFLSQESNNLTQVGNGFTSNSLLYDLSAASFLQINSNDELIYKYQAFFGRINYNFSNKYILNITGRRDGSSRFGPNNQYANFGAVGMAWLFYNENFSSDHLNFLSFGKLRGSYGTTGNDQIGDYQFMDTYSSSGYHYQGINGLQPTSLYNPNFSWEINKKLEAALELGFIKDRIFLTTAWYQNTSSNQLVGYPLPATTGFTTIQSNWEATVQNTGFELTINTLNIQKSNFNWSTSFNLSIPNSKLIEFPGLESSAYKNDYVIGKPITIKKTFHFTGINPETGIYEFEDVNGDGIISYEDDRQTVKDLAPQFYGGLQNQLSYKNWKLDFLFQFVKQQNYNLANTQGYAGLLRNQPSEYIDSWVQPGDNATYQLYTTGLNQEAMTASEYFAESDAAISDASYIRLENIALTYNLPLTGLKNTNCSLSLQGQNLLTFTNYKGADPEFTQAGVLPPLKILALVLQLTF